MQKKFFIYLAIATIISSCTKDLQNSATNNQNPANQNIKSTKNDNEFSRKTLYFATNSFEVSSENLKQDIANIKSSLSQNSKFTIMVEGHCDERGSNSYNFKLGKKRAHAIKKLLVKNGVSPKKVAVVSYGETKPAVAGNYESAWQQNRRAEIVIVK